MQNGLKTNLVCNQRPLKGGIASPGVPGKRWAACADAMPFACGEKACRPASVSFLTRTRSAFTFVEVVAAVALLGIMLSGVLVLMNQYVGAVMDMRLRHEAFQLARSNMETLLSESKLPDIYEYGDSETNPDIQWQTVVEPFYEPYKGRMWIRAVCSASFMNSKDEEEDVELEHWITNLTAAQMRQILAQQQIEDAYMDLLKAGQYSDAQLATMAYLEQAGLDVQSYQDLLEEHRRKKLEYLNKKGMDGWEKYLEELVAEENEFLEDLGMDFDAYNEFAATYVPPASDNPLDTFDPENPNDYDPENPDYNPETDQAPDTDPSQPNRWDWANIPRELWPLIEKLTGDKAPSQ